MLSKKESSFNPLSDKIFLCDSVLRVWTYTRCVTDYKCVASVHSIDHSTITMHLHICIFLKTYSGNGSLLLLISWYVLKSTRSTLDLCPLFCKRPCTYTDLLHRSRPELGCCPLDLFCMRASRASPHTILCTLEPTTLDFFSIT